MIEKEIIGAMLLSEKACDESMTHLDGSDFESNINRDIFNGCCDLIEKGYPVDYVSVGQHLKDGWKWGNTDLMGYLKDCVTDVIAPDLPGYHIRKLKDLSIERKTANLCKLFLAKKISRDDLSVSLQEQELLPREYTRKIGDGIEDTLEYIEAMQKGDSSIAGIKTGFCDIDKKIGGIKKGNYVVVGGRPSMGKTLLALNVARRVAKNYGKPVYIFSYESSFDELVQRLLYAEAKVSENNVRDGYASADDWERMTRAAAVIKDLPIYVCHQPDLKPTGIRAKARQFVRRHPDTAMIMVDYLQNIPPESPSDDEYKAVSKASRAICTMGKELEVPVLAVSQLSRKTEDSADMRPMLSHLRASGQIEQDADFVIFVDYKYRHKNGSSEDYNNLTAIIAKGRDARCGDVDLTIFPEEKRIENTEGRIF